MDTDISLVLLFIAISINGDSGHLLSMLTYLSYAAPVRKSNFHWLVVDQ